MCARGFLNRMRCECSCIDRSRPSAEKMEGRWFGSGFGKKIAKLALEEAIATQ